MTQWNSADGQDNRVADRGAWGNLPDSLERFPDRAGVYLFANIDLHIKYVGKAGASRLREEAKDAYYSREKGRGATKATWLATNSNENAKSLEQDLIDYYDPTNNIA